MKRWLRYSLQLFSFLLFGLILWWAGPETWRQILQGNWRLLAVALLLYGAAGLVSAIRLRLVTQALASAHMASRRRFYYLNMMARALGLVLPRGISALGGKSVGLRSLGISLKRSLWIVMTDNFYDVMSLAVVAIPAVFFLQGQMGTASFGLLAAALWLALGTAIWAVIASGRLAPLLQWTVQRLPWLSRRLQMDTRTAQNLFPHPQPAVGALLWTVLLNVLLISTYYAIGEALGLDAPWWLFAASFPIAQLSLIIAIAPGGLGIFDLGWLGLLRLGGLSQSDAITFVVAQRAYIFVFVLVWAAFSALLSLTEGQGKPLWPLAEPTHDGSLPDRVE